MQVRVNITSNKSIHYSGKQYFTSFLSARY